MTNTPSVVTVGETMGLLTSPEVSPFCHQHSLELSIGGAESNVAIALARAGIDTTWISALGDDPVASLIRRELTAEGVSVHARIHPSRPTGLMIKDRHSATRTNVLYYRSGSAAATLHPSDVREQTIDEADLVHLTGITPALGPTCRATIEHVIDLCRSTRTPYTFDVNYRRTLWAPDVARRILRPLLRHASVVFAGIDEAQMFTATSTVDDTVHALSELTDGYGVLKLGSDGAIASIDGSLYRQEAHRVPVVDTVGAGDAFVAGYIICLLARTDPDIALRTAVVYGGLACTVKGDWQGAPNPTDLNHIATTESVNR